MLRYTLSKIPRNVLLLMCTALCGSGMYYSVAVGSCLVCPNNSIGVESGLSECPCEMGYYRAPGEEANFSCTRNNSHTKLLITTC